MGTCKFTQTDLDEAVEDLGTMPFFPSASAASVVRELVKMCPHREALRWLVSTVVAQPIPWPGVGELRGVLCTRYEPADGVDAWSTLRGFTAADGEQRYLEAHQERKQLEAGPITDESMALIRQISSRRL